MPEKGSLCACTWPAVLIPYHSVPQCLHVPKASSSCWFARCNAAPVQACPNNTVTYVDNNCSYAVEPAQLYYGSAAGEV